MIGGAEVWRVRLENLDERFRKASRTELEDALQDLVQNSRVLRQHPIVEFAGNETLFLAPSRSRPVG
jgi:hypothetical protein